LTTTTARGFVLKTIKYGEADLVVHALNAQGARQHFFARGALRSRKRFGGGVLEPTHYLEMTYKESRRVSDDGAMHDLQEARVIREFAGLRTDYERLRAALHFVKLIHAWGKEGVVDSPELFHLLGNALQATETSQDLHRLRVHFEVRLLASQGVIPHEEALRPWLVAPIEDHAALEVSEDLSLWTQAFTKRHLEHYVASFKNAY
jgi:DNA repair protein RecO (recombination protein O)